MKEKNAAAKAPGTNFKACMKIRKRLKPAWTNLFVQQELELNHHDLQNQKRSQKITGAYGESGSRLWLIGEIWVAISVFNSFEINVCALR